ncbi:hypothetical protein [Segetibacter koreensis]|uniref:hypothetical protein n=1 Tax=Segetibacter koreensis TaxID=398037 RepID=UPI0003789603|nr:hypothetical protein [Segetibacter koreensis]
MKKYNYIAYSLWGDKPIYNFGIIKNIQQAKEIYPGWKVIVYYDDTVPAATIENIKKEGGDVVNMTGISYGMFWRFFAADLPDCDHVIFRDSDSRLSVREKMAVDEWIESGRSIHIMRDHPSHKIPFGSDSISMLGGMWGIKGNLVQMKELIEKFSEGRVLDYGIDQAFLKEIQTRFVNDCKVHDEFFSNAPFPIKRHGYRFIGERIDENDQPVGNDAEKIKKFYADKNFINRGYSLFKRMVGKLKAGTK